MMKSLSPDEIAHITQGSYPKEKDKCQHQNIITVDKGYIYLCLDCGMESRRIADFNIK